VKLAVFALTLIASSLAAPSAGARVVRFNGGEAIVEAKGGLEHVVIKSLDGVVASDSYCDAQSGTYDHIVRLGLAIRAASRAGDRARMATLFQYPLRVNVPSHARGVRIVEATDVKSKSQLLARYRTVFTKNVLQQLAQIEPHDVFCRNGMSSLGGGVVWATVDRDGALKIAVLNQ
jgi:hypothetical protein